MRHRFILTIFILTLFSNPTWAQNRINSTRGKAIFVPDEVLVRLKDSASYDDRAKVLGSYPMAKALHRPDLFKLKLSQGQDVQSTAELLKGNKAVAWAQPNYRYYACGPVTCIPPDQYYTGPENWPFVKIQAPEAWELVGGAGCPGTQPGDAGVTVAVLDTGISRNHPDLPVSIQATGYNFIGDSTNTDDDFGHGTFVAGIIAAQWNYNISESCPPHQFTTGMAGMARVTLLPVKVLDNTGSGTSDGIASGTDFAVTQGARIINFSLGASSIDQIEQDALDRALAANCVIVASAGNDSGVGQLAPLNYPAAYPRVIAVGASDNNDKVAVYSNGGEGLALVAPGGAGVTTSDPITLTASQNILSALLQCPVAASPKDFEADPNDDNFGYGAGTSASAPFVTGTAALILTLDPGLTNDQIAQRIINNADPINGTKGWDPSSGYGRLNVYQALLNTGGGQVIPFVKTFNSPNPFYVDMEGTTNITLVLTQAQPVDLTINDEAGMVVFHHNYAASELNNNPTNPQFKSFYVPWDGRNGNGQEVKTGVYFYTVKADGQTGHNKIAVIRGSK
jgi:subtilisin family serine protease